MKTKNGATIAVLSLLAILFSFSCKKASSPETTEVLGAIHVNSTPSAAQIWLDGQNTGKLTNVLLTKISPGTHTVKLIREGYEDYQQTVNIKAGITVQVNAFLKGHTFTITNPAGQTTWVARDQMMIKWTTSASAAVLGDSGSAQDDAKILVVTNVKLDLYEDNNLNAAIISSLPNSGEYLWQIPKENGGGSEYKIRVSVQGESGVYGESQPFTICYNVQGTYQGFINVAQGTTSLSVPIIYTQTQTGKEIVGSWTTTQGPSGTTKGTIDKNKITVNVKLAGESGDYNGTMDIESNGDKLTLKFSGYTSLGFLTAEFTGLRQ